MIELTKPDEPPPEPYKLDLDDPVITKMLRGRNFYGLFMKTSNQACVVYLCVSSF